ncbi:MAG TPA: leucyl aminopeptidase [Anaerolineaceae bacterium]
MNNTFTPPAPGIRLEKAALQPGRLTVFFQSAPEKPAPGEPGKSAGDILFLRAANGNPTLTVSLGKREKIKADTFRQAGGALATWLINQNASEAQLDTAALEEFGVPEAAAALCEGLLLGAFRFVRYKSAEDSAIVPTLYLVGSDAFDKTLDEAQKLAAAVNLARDWGHEPANVINPVTLAARVSELAGQYNLKVTVIDDKQLQEMGAGAIHAVGKGSRTPSRMILIEYPSQDDSGDPVVLVGKAITFDTGGYSLKDVSNILGMKYDKCGALAVIAAVVAAASLGLKTRVIGVVAAAENMVSGEAYRPDDILTTLSGKTVEIISTDAEGRLVLADALTYAARNLKPRAMVDFATLTGGCVVALGKVRAGLMSNDDGLANALFTAGETTHERLWRLPLDEDYDQQIKGDDGDIKNSGGREASAIIGGMFLKNFVTPEIPWAHVDIAGTATTDKNTAYCQKGATGFGVRLVVEYLKSL